MSDRERRRRGAHASIAGDAADEVIASLVEQFSDPYAFVRELIQNSLDAGASRVDVRMRWTRGVLEIAVVDDGEGMDRATIEGYLLVKFRSTKDKDLTKIGKFGIGFVSLFATRPREVVVDTGRDAVWHQVRFGEDLSYTLLEMPDPFEGTTVTLRLDRDRDAAADVCRRVHDSAVRWCRYAEADILTSAEGIAQPWFDRSIRAPFTVDAPITVRDEGDGYVAVLGPHPGDKPPIGFYNRGLTLWEAEEAMVPGVTFRVAARHLEHTLTRDNVIRDRHFEQVVARVRDAAQGRLGAAVHDAIVAASADRAAVARIFAAIGPRVPWKWRTDVPMLPTIGAAPATLAGLRAGLLDRVLGDTPLLCSGDDARLAARIAAKGTLVLDGGPDDPHVLFAARWSGRNVVAVSARFRCAEPVEADAATRSLWAEAGRDLGGEIHLGRFAGGLPGGALAISQPAAFEPVRLGERGPVVVIDADHPLVSRLTRVPAPVAVPLAARALRLTLRPYAPDPTLVPALIARLGGRS